MDTNELIENGAGSGEGETVDVIVSLSSPPDMCGVRLKTAGKTAVCLIAVGLALITIGVIVEVISVKTQTEHTAKVARHWKETPLDTFGIFFIVLGVCSLTFGIFTMARVALVVRKMRRHRNAYDGRDRTVTSVSGYVEDKRDNGHRLESFPSIDESPRHGGFIAKFIRRS